MSDMQSYQERILLLEHELEQMTDALSSAWEQLAPLLESAPTAAEDADNIAPIIQAICAGVDVEFGGVYLFSMDDWIAQPEHITLPSDIKLKVRNISPDETYRNILSEDGSIRWLFVPIISEDDVTGVIGIGTSDVGRTLSAVEMRIVHRMAERFGSQISAAKLARMRVREAAMQREMEIAREIQQAIQPSHPPTTTGIDMAVHWLPARQVGGDAWCWMQVGDRLHWFSIDVAGKVRQQLWRQFR